ncbi:MAG: 16S rRNA (uracil(1498)-N(3))-methyltransferase [Bacteroidota bacterium]
MNLFYHPNITPKDTQVVFEKDESRHITKVLRKTERDVLHITNGKGQLFYATLEMVGAKQSLATITRVMEQHPLPYRLHMAVAPTKNNDRFEWFLEKATEIGIDTITPIICDRSERKVIKPERFERIIESAMKQSLKAYKPKLGTAVSFSEFLNQTKDTSQIKCIAHCSDIPKKRFKDVIATREDLLILIGPEGDFSDKEIQLAEENGFLGVSLGSSRLRTETAAIAACHSVSFMNL